MPLGNFLFIIDQGKLIRNLQFIADPSQLITIGDNEILRIRTGHADKKYVLTILPDFQILSYKKEWDIKRRIVEIIGGVILEKDVNSSIHKDALEMFVTQMSLMKDETNEVISAKLPGAFTEFFDKPQFILDKKDLEKRLSEKVKDLNKKGKFNQANKLLAKIKKIPNKLYLAHDSGEKAYNRKDFDKAIKEYKFAKKWAGELEERELVSMYKTKIDLAKKTPTLLKKLDDSVENALDSLRNDQFAKAQKWFKRASEIAEKLMDSRHAEEYSLKAKALAEYVNVSKQFS
ncbi:MAG: hypothetical protein ACTSVU_00675 [Promethearchaeota archaeon]